jgi:methylated-DNA-[protein]-cysteine S-methyltransferase
MKHYHDTWPTPFGDFSVALDDNGALVATVFGGMRMLRARFAAGELVRDSARTEQARREIDDYFAGRRRRFTLRLAAQGTPFQHAVWARLQGIPLGETRTYGELAAALGRPGAARAVGRANATNPLCLVVPCHRVIGADGALTGFAFGEELKRRLLAHEQSFAALPTAPSRSRAA